MFDAITLAVHSMLVHLTRFVVPVPNTESEPTNIYHTEFTRENMNSYCRKTISIGIERLLLEASPTFILAYFVFREMFNLALSTINNIKFNPNPS